MKRTLILVTSLMLGVLAFSVAPFAAGAQGGSVYVVQAGDTAYSIATRYCMSSQELMSLNAGSMPNPSQLYPGMQVQVINRCGGGSSGGNAGGGYPNCGWGNVYDRGPRLHAQGHVSGNLYIVARGDTSFSIAQRFGTSTYALGQSNGINPWYIYAGQRLILPAYGGGWCQQPCTGYGGSYGYNCQPPIAVPPVYPIPITPVPTVPVVQPALQITSPAPNAVLPPTFTVTGTGQGLYGGNLAVRAQTATGAILADQPVTLQGPNVGSGGSGAFSTQLTVNVAAPTPGFIVAYAPQTAVPAVSVPVTFSPGGPSGVTYTPYTGMQCVVTVISGAPYSTDVNGAATGSFPAAATYTATRGAKFNNQLWFEISGVPSTTTSVWTPITGVSSLSPTCYW